MSYVDELGKSRHSGEACAGLDPVTGVQTICNHLERLDSGFCRNDKKMVFFDFLRSRHEIGCIKL